MSRPLRIEYAGAIYHITSRGIDRREIFRDDKDREHFVQLLREGADFDKVEVMAYCLMPNHFHFLLSTKKPNLSRFMQRMNTAYTRYFNYKYKRVGPLMQGRYKALLVGSPEYLVTLSRYIYLNPVKVKPVAKKSQAEQELLLRGYKWSSYAGVLNSKKRSRYFHCERVLDFIGGDNEAGRKRYEDYVLAGIPGTAENPMSEVKSQFLLGSEEFIKQIREDYLKGKDLKQFKPQVREIRQPTISEIAGKVAKEYGVSPAELLEARSKHKEARKVLIELSYRICLEDKTLRELGRELGGISGAGIGLVHTRLKEEIKKDSSLEEKIAKIAAVIC
jgi:putative transposase